MKRNTDWHPKALTWCQIVANNAKEGEIKHMGNDDKRVNLRVTQGMWQEIVDMQEWLKLRTTAECVRHLIASALEAHKFRANHQLQTSVLENMRDIQGSILEETVKDMTRHAEGLMDGGSSNTPTEAQN